METWYSRAASWKVACSIPVEVIGFFNWPNPSSRALSLSSIQPLTEMSTRNHPGATGSKCIRLTASPTSVRGLSRKCGSLDISQPYRLPWPVTGIDIFSCEAWGLAAVIKLVDLAFHRHKWGYLFMNW
jgi:hypothetical protein